MQLYTPFCDITELGQLCRAQLPGAPSQYYDDPKAACLAAFPKAEALIKTPLAFAHFANREGYVKHQQKMLEDAGWKLLTSALNWHAVHHGDSELLIYFKRFLNKPFQDFRPVASHMYGDHQSFLYGCGGRIITGLKDFERPAYWQRFLTLLRVETGLTAEQKKWLTELNYRPAPELETLVAEYWVNGWAPGTWPGKTEELAFWDKWKRPEQQGEKRAALKQS